MEEIEVEEYIRVVGGRIFKARCKNNRSSAYTIVGEHIINEDGGIEPKCIEKKYILKHSPNIIDLIEVGDYVNGVEVIHFQDDIFNSYYELANHFLISRKKPEDIKTIVTKEQFKSVMYEVK